MRACRHITDGDKWPSNSSKYTRISSWHSILPSLREHPVEDAAFERLGPLRFVTGVGQDAQTRLAAGGDQSIDHLLRPLGRDHFVLPAVYGPCWHVDQFGGD